VVREYMSGKMVTVMKDHGLMVLKMAKEPTNFLVEIPTQALMRMAYHMVRMEFIDGNLVLIFKVNL
jgi:hypothetical protein